MYVNLFLNFKQFEPEHDGKDYQTDSESDSDDNCDQSIHSAKSQGEEKRVREKSDVSAAIVNKKREK